VIETEKATDEAAFSEKWLALERNPLS